MQRQLLLVKNAAANIARGGAIAAFSLLLPPFLVRHMPSAEYAVWVLVLQITAYIGYLDFGLQIAVGRYIAYAEERRDAGQRDSIYSTALFGLQLAAVSSCIVLAVLVLGAPHFFPALPSSLITTMRWATAIVGVSVALGLPANAFNGVFIGLEKNEIPAASTGGAKILSFAGIVAVILGRGSLVAMALVVAVTNLLAYLIQYLTLRRLAAHVRFRFSCVKVWAARDLFRYCSALTIMSFSMLLITGFDLVLVGHFDFGRVVPYSIAASFIPVLGGLLYAVLNAMMAPAARRHARAESTELGRMAVSSTRLGTLLILLTGLPGVIYAGPIMRLWIGSAYAQPGRKFLIILLIANMIRLVGAGYSIILVATGEQFLIKISPLAEGISNLALSILLGMSYGAAGVALGTLVGAIISVLVHLVYNMPRTQEKIEFSRADFLYSGILKPAVCVSPLIAAAVYSSLGHGIAPGIFLLVFAISTVAGLKLLQQSGALPSNIARLWPIRAITPDIST